MSTATRQLASIFHRFEGDKQAFASQVADAARFEGSAAPLAALGAPRQLLPLLDDSGTIAHTAAVALGRLAGHSRTVAAGLADAGVVCTLVHRLKQQQDASGQPGGAIIDDGTPTATASRRASMALLVSLTRQSAITAGIAAEQGGLQAAVDCLNDPDTEVKEGAAWTLAHLAAHSQELAGRVCASGALPRLVACLGGADLAVRCVAASALSDICRHSPALASAVVEAGAVRTIASLLRQPLGADARLKRQLLCALMHIARAGAGLAEAVVDVGLVADVSRCLKFSDGTVRRHSAACLRDIAGHTPALAAVIADAPGVLDALSTYAAATPSAQALPALLAFGFIAGHSVELADRAATAPGAVHALVTALQCGDEPAQAAAAWALGRIGGHSPPLAQLVAPCLLRLCCLAGTATPGVDLQIKCAKAAAALLAQLGDVTQLAALAVAPADEVTPQLAELALSRCTALMAKQPALRKEFATSGALAKLEARAEGLAPGDPAAEVIATCLRLFPTELLNHYSATHAAKLLAALGSDPPLADTIPAVPAHGAASKPAPAAEVAPVVEQGGAGAAAAIAEEAAEARPNGITEEVPAGNADAAEANGGAEEAPSPAPSPAQDAVGLGNLHEAAEEPAIMAAEAVGPSDCDSQQGVVQEPQPQQQAAGEAAAVHAEVATELAVVQQPAGEADGCEAEAEEQTCEAPLCESAAGQAAAAAEALPAEEEVVEAKEASTATQEAPATAQQARAAAEEAAPAQEEQPQQEEQEDADAPSETGAAAPAGTPEEQAAEEAGECEQPAEAAVAAVEGRAAAE